MTSSPGRLAGQIGVSLVALAAVAFVMAPTQFREQAGAAALLERLVFATGETAAMASCALALAMLWLQPRHPATPVLALCLTLAGLAFGAVSAKPPSPFAEFLGLPERFWQALTATCAVLVTGGIGRLSVLFPRPVAPGEIERLAATWQPGAERGRPRTRWQRFYRSSDKLSMALLRSLPLSHRRRRHLARLLIQDPRRLILLDGRPVVPGSVFGMPWTAWNLAVLFAGVAALAFAFLDTDAARYSSGLLGAILVAHALPYFALAYRMSNAPERRKSLWAFAGLLIFLGLVALGGLVAIAIDLSGLATEDQIRQGARLTVCVGWLTLLSCLSIAIFRDGVLDPALVIRKTAVYGLIAAATSILFVALEVAVARLVAAHVQFAADFGPAIAAALVAATFRPLHRWIERATRGWLDRVVPASALAEGKRLERVVVFSDLCGYTGLTAADERSALTLASLFHKKARRLAEEHGGRLVKTIGDAVLLEFDDVERALHACRALPAAVAAAAEALELPQATLRTGAHFGEVVRAPDGDLFGGTVNLAARLQTTAAPGELIVSGAIAQHRAAPSSMKFEHLGARTLKNVPRPVDCYRVAPA